MRKVIFVVLAALTVGGCTVRTTDPDGGPRSPVHIQVSHPPADDKPGATATPGSGSGSAPTPTPAPTPKKAPPAPVPPAPVLWSRGDSGRDVRELQARLHQVAWLYDGPTGSYDDLTENAVKGFQGKRGLPRTGKTDTVTWQRLLRMTHEPGQWELYLTGGQPAAYPDARCLRGRVLCISKSSRTLRWMIDGRTVSTVAVRFGSQYTPTREGVFSVYWKSRHHVSTLYDSPMPYAMFFSGGQAVHYSADFAARGYGGASHGCVNVRDETAIAAIFAEVSTGDKVVIYW
ncbi:L,D-transpeptidase family protein [Streptomyces turgidiscabies]|uniref:L,D-transpeptidase family protein n=1 Tax=Streptomyces TaxID=1883 RepID=UPI000995E158|nr:MULTISPECIES: L,D-transpeptidase family protein [Streptomyces]MDX3497880.1 L,D-transpeptidase family protein [Streptomyces turgidiscabies]